MALGITKNSIALLSILVLVSSGLASNQAFAGGPAFPHECQDCIDIQEFFDQICIPGVTAVNHGFFPNCAAIEVALRTCAADFCPSVGGVFEGVDTTSLLVSGTQMNAAWMIPVIVAGIGIGIVIARKF